MFVVREKIAKGWYELVLSCCCGGVFITSFSDLMTTAG
jgi:hypothetical protein